MSFPEPARTTSHPVTTSCSSSRFPVSKCRRPETRLGPCQQSDDRDLDLSARALGASPPGARKTSARPPTKAAGADGGDAGWRRHAQHRRIHRRHRSAVDANDVFKVMSTQRPARAFSARMSRQGRPDLHPSTVGQSGADKWSNLVSAGPLETDGPLTLSDPEALAEKSFYRVGVALAPGP